MKFWVFSVVSFFLLIGCAKEQGYKPYKYPSWYYHPPQSEFYYYAIGEGSSVAEAKSAAMHSVLEQMQSRLDDNVSMAIRFVPPRIVEMLEHKKSVVLLLSVDKHAIYEINKKNLDRLFLRIERIDEASGDEFILRYMALKRRMDDLKDLEQKIAFLEMLDPTFDGEPYRVKYKKYEQKIALLSEAIRIALRGDFETIAFLDDVKAILKEEHIKVLQSAKRFVSDYTLLLSGSCDNEEFSLEIVLNNFEDIAIAHNHFKFTCKTEDEKRSAFKALLKKQSIYTLLGL